MCLGTGRELVLLLYKGKGDFRVCGSYRRISLLSVVGKVYGRVLIERVVECKDRAIWWWGGGQCGFRKWMVVLSRFLL